MAVLTQKPVTFETDTDLRRLASARRDRVRFVDVPEKRYLAVEGTEPPGGEGFQHAIQTLYRTAYPLHFTLRGRGIRGHRIGMLEGLYCMTPEELLADAPTDAARRIDWRWRLILAVPDEATDAEIDAAIRTAGGEAVGLRVERWAEGPSAQILHVGPYDAEAPTIRRLHEAITAAGLRARGAHHEIYLSDPGRTAPDRVRTVLRQPVER
jgi:hypothetical protein